MTSMGLNWLPAMAGSWVPAALRLPSFLTFNFAVEIEGLLVGGFTDVSGLESEVAVVLSWISLSSVGLEYCPALNEPPVFRSSLPLG